MKRYKAVLFACLILSSLLLSGINTLAGEYSNENIVKDAAVVVFSNQICPLLLDIKQDVVETGIAAIDELNRELGVTDMWPLFPSADKHGKPEMVGFYSITFDSKNNLETVLAEFAKLPIVEYAEPVTVHRTFFTPNDPSLFSQWGLARVEAENAWDVGQGSSDVILGITDTGVDWDHPDLADKIWINEDDPVDGLDNDDNDYPDDYHGWDWVNGVSGWPGEDTYTPDNDPMDFDGHGTHCSGIAAASTNNGIGIAGLGFNCRIMALRVGWKGADGNGYVRMDFAASAFYYAANNGAKALNCSWGSSGSGALRLATDYAVAQGVVIVTAAGNDNSMSAPYLGTRQDVIAVASTNNSDHKSGFSNYGTWVDVSAPGSAIYSTYFDNAYFTLDGTSMAAPFVVGLAGLIMASEPSLSRAEVITRIIGTTDDIDGLNPGYEGWLGSGRINAYAALAAHLCPRLILTDTDISLTVDDGDGILNPGEFFELIITLENTWSDAFNVTAIIGSNQYFNSLDSAVIFGDIYHNDSGANTNHPFTIAVKQNIIPGNRSLNALILADGGFSTEIEIPITVLLTQAGFPLTISGNIESSPLIADFDDDGANEILFGSNDDSVYAIEADGSYNQYWPQSVANDVISGPAVGDLDNNGDNELVAVSKNGMLYAWNSDATPLDGFPVDLGTTVYGGPMLVDFDGDSDLEIVVGGLADRNVYIFNRDGQQSALSPIGGTAGWFGSAASADLDEDSIREIIYGGLDSLVHAWTTDGSELNGFPVHLNGPIYGSVVIGDVDGDLLPEIAAVTFRGNYYLINHDGTISDNHPVDVGANVLLGPALADIDGNLAPEVLFSDNNRNLHVFNFTGEEISGFPVTCDDAIKSSPVIADITGDGRHDIIVGCSSGMLYGFDAYGNPLTHFPLFAGVAADIKDTPALGDLDGDSDLEIAFGLYHSGEANFVVIDCKDPAYLDSLAWPNSGCDSWRSGNLPVSIPTSVNDQKPLPAGFSLSRNYPNPFNASTTIRYELPKATKVSVEIFDILGRKIETLIAERQSAGRHNILWQAGQRPSGIYFYKIQAGDFSEVRRCVLLK